MSGPPVTYLITAPTPYDDFGREILSADFVKKLRGLNPMIRAEEKSADGLHWPGKFCYKPTTTLWLAPNSLWYVGMPGGRKLTSMPLGPIPEWSKVDEDGRVLFKGWRAILEKLILTHVITRHQAEATFDITMHGRRKSKYCVKCQQTGVLRNGYGTAVLCTIHDMIHKRTAAFSAQQEAMKCQVQTQKPLILQP